MALLSIETKDMVGAQLCTETIALVITGNAWKIHTGFRSQKHIMVKMFPTEECDSCCDSCANNYALVSSYQISPVSFLCEIWTLFFLK